MREPLSVSALRQSVCLMPARLLGKEAGNQSALRDIKTPTMHRVLPLTPLRHREKAIKAFIGFALKICSRQLKIITNQIKIEVAQLQFGQGID